MLRDRGVREYTVTRTQSKRSKTVPSDASSEPLSEPSSGGHGRPRRQVFRAVRRGCLQGAAPQSCGALNPQLGMLLVIMLLSATLVLRIPKISSSKFGTRTCSLRRCCIRACTRACLRVLGDHASLLPETAGFRMDGPTHARGEAATNGYEAVQDDGRDQKGGAVSSPRMAPSFPFSAAATNSPDQAGPAFACRI